MAHSNTAIGGGGGSGIENTGKCSVLCHLHERIQTPQMPPSSSITTLNALNVSRESSLKSS